MELKDLRPNEGATKRRRRVGRGTAAGQGKTAGRGTKGQSSRQGAGGNLYRQGGNLPFYRRLPFQRGEGFTPPNQVEYNEINVFQLSIFAANSEVSLDELADARLISKSRNPVAILGHGDINKALKVRVHRVTKSAREKIEAAGGSVELIGETAE
jgi:large subunit ribosomal protein L15